MVCRAAPMPLAGIQRRAACRAAVLKRAFRIPALICPDCRGKRQIAAAIHDPGEVERFLRHLQLWPEPGDDLVAIRGPPEDL